MIFWSIIMFVSGGLTFAFGALGMAAGIIGAAESISSAPSDAAAGIGALVFGAAMAQSGNLMISGLALIAFGALLLGVAGIRSDIRRAMAREPAHTELSNPPTYSTDTRMPPLRSR